MEQGAVRKRSTDENLNDDNIRLQEDLNFFQNLTAASGKEANWRFTADAGTRQDSWRIPCAYVAGAERQRSRSSQAAITRSNIGANGRKTTRLFRLMYPACQFHLKFKYYQRMEQSLRISPDVQLQSIQVRFSSKAYQSQGTQSVNLLSSGE